MSGMSDPSDTPSGLEADLQHWARALVAAEAAAAGAPPGTARARALLDAGRAKWHLDDLVGCVRFALAVLEDKHIDTPPELTVGALTMAAFTLLELGAAAQAQPLAHRALMLARTEALFDRLHLALSCAAAIAAINGDLERAEALHQEALARAGQASGIEPLQMALCNVLSSWILVLRQGDPARAEEVCRCSRRHVAQARFLKDDARLPPWRRMILQEHLGELLGLCGVQPEGETLLAQCLADPATRQDAVLAQSVATVLAEQLAGRGACAEALALLQAQAHFPEHRAHRGGFQRHLQALRTTEACLRQLGRLAEAEAQAHRIADQVRLRNELRDDAVRALPPEAR